MEADYLSNLDGLAGAYKHSHLPKQQALDLVGDAFAKQNVHIHFDVGPNYAGNASTTTGANPDPYIIQKGAGGNSISESVTVCNDSPGSPCPFPGQAAIGWKGGFISVKDSVPWGNFPVRAERQLPLHAFRPLFWDLQSHTGPLSPTRKTTSTPNWYRLRTQEIRLPL